MQSNFITSSPFNEIGESFLETKFGRIFHLCCGFHGDPLILVIHGSGPRNSSREYEFFLFEYIAKVCFLRRFFIVAIDCPGYGNSTGSKQSVRSYPLELIEEILIALNYPKAYALFGHSQGGSSIFNAVFQKPTITDILVMDRPVCGDIKRFQNFPLPCLLIYDIEDDGHPIVQGRLLNRYLKYSQLITFRTSRDQYWIADNLWDSLLGFIRKIEDGMGKRSSSLNEKKGKNGVIPSEAADDGFEFGHVNLHVRTHHSEEKRPQTIENLKEKIEKSRVNKIKEKKSKGLPKKLIPIENQAKVSQIPEQTSSRKEEEKKEETHETPKKQEATNQQKIAKKVSNNLESSSKSQKLSDKRPEKLEEEEEKKLDFTSKPSANSGSSSLESNYLCPLCLDLLYKPVSLPCKHNFCITCLTDLAFYDPKCPLCRKEFPEKYDISEKNLNFPLISEMKERLPEKRIFEREQKATQDQQKGMNKKTLFMGYGYEFKEMATKPRIGNAQNPKKYEWKVYIKQLNFQKQNMIKFVEFDINIGVIGSKPIKVEKTPFVLEGKGGYNFTANIKVTWDNKLRIPPYETMQRVDFGPNNRMRKFMIKLN